MKAKKILQSIKTISVAITIVALCASNFVGAQTIEVVKCGYGTRHVYAVSSTCNCVYGNLCQPNNGWTQIDAHDQCDDWGTGTNSSCVNQVNPGPEGHYINSCSQTFNWSAFFAAYGLNPTTWSSIFAQGGIGAVLSDLLGALSGWQYYQAVGDVLWDCNYVTCQTNLGDPWPDNAVPVLSGTC
jgi:hypothetical protein